MGRSLAGKLARVIKLRETTLEDATAISELSRRNGMGEVAPETWRDRWTKYPFAAEFRDVPMGWVLEGEGGSVVGSFANVHMLYEIGGKRLRGCIGCEWAVDEQSRGMSLQLLDRFLRQCNVDICIVSSASPVTSELLSRLKLPRIPAPDYDRPLLWATHARLFAGGALRKRGIKAAEALAWPAGAALALADLMGRVARAKPSSQVSRLTGFDERFDGFWERVRRGPRRMRAIRTRSAMEWRFEAATKEKAMVILVSERDQGISGYALLVRRFSPDLRLSMYDVADLQALNDEPSTYRDLLLGALDAARSEGVAALKLLTSHAVKRAVAAELRPHSYHVPVWQLFFKARDPDLALKLSSADLWEVSLFDNF